MILTNTTVNSLRWCINTETCRIYFNIHFTLLICAYDGILINNTIPYFRFSPEFHQVSLINDILSYVQYKIYFPKLYCCTFNVKKSSPPFNLPFLHSLQNNVIPIHLFTVSFCFSSLSLCCNLNPFSLLVPLFVAIFIYSMMQSLF